MTGGDFEDLTTVAGGGTSFVDTTTVQGGSYEYTVTGLFGNEESHDCPVVAATAVPELASPMAVGLASIGGLAALVVARRRKA